MKIIFKITLITLPFISMISCKKLTQVGEPINTTTTKETFASEALANSAIVAIYNDMVTGHGGSNGRANFSFGNGFASVATGMSADELHIFGNSPFETNTLAAASGESGSFWVAPYFDIYLSNAAIEGLANSSTITAATKAQLTGEAKFFRAFCHFYLVNLFGDVPYLTTTAYTVTDTMRRMPAAQVYQLIIKDLIDAQDLLAADYSISGDERVRVNKFGATALLARSYLYNGEWAKAEEQASAVIDRKDLYDLETDLNTVFLKTSKEAILQLQTPNAYPYATFEGNNILPYDEYSPPNYYLTDQLINDFEPDDQRRVAWVGTSDNTGDTYYYPYKYKVNVGTKDNIDEYCTVLRLAEQYLIRAEARAQQSRPDEAIADLNVIRKRANLGELSTGLTKEQVLAAVAHERRIELFAEWGHRWLDLKRTGQAVDVLKPIKPLWKNTAILYPIPSIELINDGNLVQNPGY